MLIRATGTMLAATAAIALSLSLALAQTPPADTKAAPKTTDKKTEMPKKPLSQLSCEEFNGLDETFKPKVIAFAAGYKQGQKKPEDVVIDIDGVEKITPLVVTECTRAPTSSFWGKVDAELKKIF